ncbi:hypothetical protein C8F04DRAFT_1197525 [Mycena alexandri]|uniref:Uncharacterized protein n=1 Tax=Mycena alexandri TaxID=1745969 RepID=A0AAD6S334_9AGAR|nr:hypothetical protein C8F04DRAFT_1197525 [Mycena alexandri]
MSKLTEHVFHSSLELTIHRLCTTSTPPPGSLPRPLAMCLVLAINTMMANSNLKRLSQGAKTSTSGWWLGAHGHCRVHFACIHVPCDGHPDAPTSTKIHTATGADRTLHAVRGRACKHVLYGLSCTHHLIRPAPTLLLPPGPLHRQMCTHFRLAAQSPPLPPAYLHRRVYSGSSRSRSRPPFLSPLSSSQLGHAHAIPISLSPPFNGPQGAPMRMRTSFPGSKCAHCKEVERRACAGAKHEARAAAALPRHITSVEIMCAPSPGVTIGLVPKPEPESDTEPDTVIERQVTNPIKRERKLSPSL